MSTDLVRRRVCVGASAACAALIGAVIAPRAHAQTITSDHGRIVPPVPLPDIPVRRADGKLVNLSALAQGYATALHLMFTGCSTVCPIQGAIFQRLQSLLTDQRERRIQLVSLSIDPLADTPSAMRAWLARFDAHDGWIAVAPRPADLNRLLELFGQGRNAVENHATQVNIIDRRGNLVFKTQQLPSADSIAELLRQV
jgi:protein SCO1/2